MIVTLAISQVEEQYRATTLNVQVKQLLIVLLCCTLMTIKDHSRIQLSHLVTFQALVPINKFVYFLSLVSKHRVLISSVLYSSKDTLLALPTSVLVMSLS